MALPLYQFIVSDDGEGMTAISLVDSPAIESQFIAFNTNDKPKPKYICLKSDEDKYKYVVAGLALIPDKLIYRIDKITQEEYYGYFTSDTIEKIRNKFHKDKNTSEVNLQHDDENFIDAYLVESYLLDSQARVDEVLARGIDEAVLGSWFVAYKIEDKDAFDKALDGTFTGFSVEVMLNRELKLNNNSQNNNKFMDKFNGFLNKFKTLLAELESESVPAADVVLEEVKLTDAMLADGSKMVRYGNVGEAVNYVVVDEAGVETLEIVPEGEYILEDGNTLEVDANGNLVEIKAEEVAVVPVEAEVALADEPAIDEPKAGNDMDKKLSELVPLDKDGEYYISVSVYDGKVNYGSMSTWTSLKLKADAENTKVIELEAEVEKLQAEVVKPIAEPVVLKTQVEEVKKLTKQEMSKMTNLEIQLHKLGINNPMKK